MATPRSLTRCLCSMLLLGLLGPAASATASPDELYYPGSNCLPFNGSSWEGGGSDGFAFDSLRGGLYNHDVDTTRALVCPVPFDRAGNPSAPVRVRLVVEDNHNTRSVVAYLCGRDMEGQKICDSADNFPSAWGVSTIELLIQPSGETRFVWIEVAVPDRDTGSSRPGTGISGVIGYRVMRE